jgi:hypothetical protein
LTPDPDDLRRRLLEVIARGADGHLDDHDFQSLALDVFAHQYARNTPYRTFCDARGASPGTIRSWVDIPSVPTDAFKAAPLVCGRRTDALAAFRTSGTTAGRGRRGTHYFLDLTLYDAALRSGFEAAVLGDGARLAVFSLVPSTSSEPDSSLAHMVSAVMAEFGDPRSRGFVNRERGLDAPGLVAALHAAVQQETPVLLIGTSLAFLHFLEMLEDTGSRLSLPESSRVMDTGGFKGHEREVTRDELVQRFGVQFGLPEDRVINEYGMTEMSSQLYARGRGRHAGPPWLRTIAVDPETLSPLEPGAVGVLRHWDLVNMDSVAVLQTADLGRVAEDGLELLGRAAGAEARGCSIAMDELLTALKRD